MKKKLDPLPHRLYSPAMSVHIGCSDNSIRSGRYHETLNSFELLPSQEVPLKPGNAKKMADSAREDFTFTMVASRLLSLSPKSLPPGLEGELSNYGGLQLTKEVLHLFDATLRTAQALGAKVLVLPTSSEIGPGQRGRETLNRFFEKIDRHGIRIAWDPHGPWEEEQVIEVCRDLELIRCFDPLRDRAIESEVAYARLGPFAAMGRSMADDELELILEIFESFDEAYCFFATERAFKDAQRLHIMSQD